MAQFTDIESAENKYQELKDVFQSDISVKDEKLIRKAYEFVLGVYHDDKMQSGEPYLFHSLNVAKIVVKEIGLGTTSIVSALLHNVVRHSNIEINTIDKEFGRDVVRMIEGLNKIASLSTERTTLNAENFIRLLLTLSPDVHVILIKLADRLEYMRNIDKIPENVRVKISEETSHLYTPIAHRLGLYNIKTELEELSMKFSQPNIYHEIAKKINDTKSARETYIREFIQPINSELEKQGFNCDIKARSKSVSSIWNKMMRQDVEFDEVYDLFAIRIIDNSEISEQRDEKQIKEYEKSRCWKIYSMVTNIYQPYPKRLRDWITTPKASGYESLHTTVLGPEGKWAEVQIRTNRMDEIAEKGGAAHWKYKESDSVQDSDIWLRKIREKLEYPDLESKKTGNHIKEHLYSHDIFVFTPLGDLKKLPVGATVLDFAYAIHSNVGNSCTGARVNKKIVQLKYTLQNGDQVEIMTSKTQKPKLDWLKFVKTSKAKARIKRTIKELQYKDTETGKEALKRKLSQLKLSFNNQNINKLIEYFNLTIPLELYQDIAAGKIDVLDVKDCFFPPQTADKITKETSTLLTVSKQEEIPSAIRPSDLLLINGKSDLRDYHFAKCCNPVFGDKIFGFVTVGKGIKIHRLNCPNAEQMRSRYPYRTINTRWVTSNDEGPFMASLKIIGKDELGVVNNISHFITDEQRINVDTFNFERKMDKFEGIIKLYIKDSKQLDYIVSRILKISGVHKVTRIS